VGILVFLFVVIISSQTGSAPTATDTPAPTATDTPVPTATDTMNTYCNALKNHDYHTAYSLFLTPNTQYPDEKSFAYFPDLLDKTFGGLTGCTVYPVNENDSSGVANSLFSLTYGDGFTESFNARLANKSGTWKITQIN